MAFLAVLLLATSALAAPARNIAPEGAHPHQVSIKFFNAHSCGGSIIDQTTILTAAHCVQSLLPEFTSVVVGTNKLSSGGDHYTVSEIKPHSGYDPILAKNDIALVKLETPIAFNDKVKPIELETGHVGGGVDCIISGWMNSAGEVPDILQQIKLKTVESSACQSLLNVDTIDETQICASSNENRGSCNADSGNPLITKRQIGIASFGSLCTQGYPDVYTRVSAYKSWIERS